MHPTTPTGSVNRNNKIPNASIFPTPTKTTPLDDGNPILSQKHWRPSFPGIFINPQFIDELSDCLAPGIGSLDPINSSGNGTASLSNKPLHALPHPTPLVELVLLLFLSTVVPLPEPSR